MLHCGISGCGRGGRGATRQNFSPSRQGGPSPFILSLSKEGWWRGTDPKTELSLLFSEPRNLIIWPEPSHGARCLFSRPRRIERDQPGHNLAGSKVSSPTTRGSVHRQSHSAHYAKAKYAPGWKDLASGSSPFSYTAAACYIRFAFPHPGDTPNPRRNPRPCLYFINLVPRLGDISEKWCQKRTHICTIFHLYFSCLSRSAFYVARKKARTV